MVSAHNVASGCCIEQWGCRTFSSSQKVLLDRVGWEQRTLLQCRRLRFDLEVGKIPWRRTWQPSPVFLPGESHGQRSLGYPTGSQRVGHGRSDWSCLGETSVWLHDLFYYPKITLKVKVAQLCLTLWPSPWNSPGQDIGVGSLSLLQGIFPSQGLNPGLPNCRWVLHQLSHQRINWGRGNQRPPRFFISHSGSQALPWGPSVQKQPAPVAVKLCQVLLYVKWITNKVLLYNTGNSA